MHSIYGVVDILTGLKDREDFPKLARAFLEPFWIARADAAQRAASVAPVAPVAQKPMASRARKVVKSNVVTLQKPT
jgi:hypothetical protein